MEPTKTPESSPHEEGTSSQDRLTSDLLSLYLIQIRTVALLTAQDEQRLGRAIRHGVLAARALQEDVGCRLAMSIGSGSPLATARLPPTS